MTSNEMTNGEMTNGEMDSDVQSPDETDPTVAAAGADTLIGVLDEVAAEGYATQQIARRHGRIECTGCSSELASSSFRPERVRRLEGASDAADELIVVGSPCPSCGRQGVVILAYGPNANEIDVEVLEALDLTDADPSPS